MKNIVRAFVVALALTGAVASANTTATSSTKPVLNRTSSMAIPTCPPSDPNGCNYGNSY